MKTEMTTKQIADEAGVTVETIRYYERERMIDSPPRTASGYRQFPPETVVRIRFIKRAQALGFSLPEIKELLSLRLAEGTTPADIRELAQAKILAIEEKIRSLQTMQKSLQRITEACPGDGSLDACPILDALEQ